MNFVVTLKRNPSSCTQLDLREILSQIPGVRLSGVTGRRAQIEVSTEEVLNRVRDAVGTSGYIESVKGRMVV